MSRSERERSLLRRLLAIAVHRLGGEMGVTKEEVFTGTWELGMDHATLPTVVTGFRVASKDRDTL